ncbi:MAG: coenzyme F420-0:L-glutamate ligase [Alphaproteobacteria bacterium]
MNTSYPTLIPVPTRRLNPPKDDAYAALAEALPPLQNGDVLVVTSKILSIHEGRCVPDTEDRDALVPTLTPYWLGREHNTYGFMLSIIHHALIASAGIDHSNSGAYMTLLPETPTASAKALCDWLKQRHGIEKLAVIVTDSHVTPLRWGTVGIAIGAHGLQPLRDYRGQPDIFGNTMRVSQSNMIDPLAAAAVNLMGEGREQTPAVIIRHWPGLVFSEENMWDKFVIEPEADVFKPLLAPFFAPK